MPSTNKSNTIDSDEFVDICARVGYVGNADEAKQLFKQFVKHPGQMALSREDLQTLGAIVSKAAHGVRLFKIHADLTSNEESPNLQLQDKVAQDTSALIS